MRLWVSPLIGWHHKVKEEPDDWFKGCVSLWYRPRCQAWSRIKEDVEISLYETFKSTNVCASLSVVIWDCLFLVNCWCAAPVCSGCESFLCSLIKQEQSCHLLAFEKRRWLSCMFGFTTKIKPDISHVLLIRAHVSGQLCQAVTKLLWATVLMTFSFTKRHHHYYHYHLLTFT